MNLMDEVTQAQGQPQGQPPGPQTPQDEPGNTAPFTPELAKQMSDQLTAAIPPEKKEAFERARLAAKKVLYSDKTRGMVMQAIEQDVPMDQKLGHNAAGLVLILDKESGNTMPQEIMVPVGMSVVLEGAEMALAMGAEITSQDVRDGIDQMIALLMMKFGAKQDEILQTIGGGGQPQPGAQPGAQPAPPQPGAMA